MNRTKTLLILSALSSLATPGAFGAFNTLTAWGDAVGTTPAPSFTGDGSATTTITAGGADFWGNSDAGAFLWDNTGGYTTTGDFTATVRHVSTTTPAPEWGRDGILARSTIGGTPGAPIATDPYFIGFRKSNGAIEAGVRIGRDGPADNSDGSDTTEGITSGNPGFQGLGVANNSYWLGLAREGSTMHVSGAMNVGTEASPILGRWVEYGTQTGTPFNAGNQLIVGLGHQSHPQTISPDTNDINTATFANWNYSGSYNAARFGPAASAGTWMTAQSVGVNAAKKVTGAAYVGVGGVATGEKTRWTVTATQLFGKAAGLTADIYLAGNPGNQGGARGIIAGPKAGTATIPNVNWTGASDNDANYYGLTGPASFGVATQGTDPASSTTGPFSGDQENYGVHMVGEIFIPSDAVRGGVETVKFKDGIDDYTFVGIDGVTLIDDNNWTGYTGVDNGGSPIVSLDVSAAKYNDGEWVSFDMIMWEGGGGDNGVLYWDVANAGFPATQTAPATAAAIVPAANFRHDVYGPTQTLTGSDQIGSDAATAVFTDASSNTITLTPGNWRLTVTNQNTLITTSSTVDVTVVPEPASALLVSLTGMGLMLRRRRNR